MQNLHAGQWTSYTIIIEHSYSLATRVPLDNPFSALLCFLILTVSSFHWETLTRSAGKGKCLSINQPSCVFPRAISVLPYIAAIYIHASHFLFTMRCIELFYGIWILRNRKLYHDETEDYVKALYEALRKYKSWEETHKKTAPK